MRRSAFAALAAVVVLGAPSALAHIEPISQGAPVNAGPWVAYVTVTPEPIFANATLQTFRIEARSTETSAAVDVAASMALTGPDGTRLAVTFSSDGRYLVAGVRLPSPGTYNGTLTLSDADETHEAPVSFLAYPDARYRVRPLDLKADIPPEVPVLLYFEVLDHVTLQRTRDLDAMTLRIEQWSADHATLIGNTDVPLMEDGGGIWGAQHTFPRGHYYVRFASPDGGFNYADTPPFHVNVVAAPPSDEPSETPAPPALAVAAALALAALAAGRARRR